MLYLIFIPDHYNTYLGIWSPVTIHRLFSLKVNMNNERSQMRACYLSNMQIAANPKPDYTVSYVKKIHISIDHRPCQLQSTGQVP